MEAIQQRFQVDNVGVLLAGTLQVAHLAIWLRAGVSPAPTRTVFATSKYRMGETRQAYRALQGATSTRHGHLRWLDICDWPCHKFTLLHRHQQAHVRPEARIRRQTVASRGRSPLHN